MIMVYTKGCGSHSIADPIAFHAKEPRMAVGTSRIERRRDTVTPMSELPTEIYLGMTRGQWPIMAAQHLSHAEVWLSEKPQDRQLWRVRVEVIDEMELVPAAPAWIRAKKKSPASGIITSEETSQ